MSDYTPALRVLGDFCKVHAYHYPKPLRTVKHHIWPQEYGGPTVPENLVLVCDTGHYAIHTILETLLAGKPLAPGFGGRNERKLARRGFEAIQAAKH